MDITSILILATIEGLTEFLPISSTGHLILASEFLRLPDTQFQTTFNISIQAAAIAAVSVLYLGKIRQHPNLLTKSLIAFLPAGILGLLFYSFITDTLLTSPLTVILAMGVGGLVLIAIEKYIKSYSNTTKSLHQITYRKAIIIGIFQSLSLIPGTSRSAATIVGGLLTKLDRKTAVEFSFLTALPTIAAAAGLDLIQSRETLTQTNLAHLALGFLISFVVAYLTMKYFLKFLDRNTLTYFGIYRILLTLLSLLILL